ncbi:MAG: hypothetical protein RL033_8061, partial [Pseudomonadota bacterium]
VYLMALVACGDEVAKEPARQSSVGDDPRSLCPGCPGQVSLPMEVLGPDSGPDPCTLVERRSDIDRARAIELGFDVDTFEQRVTRQFRAPFRWSHYDYQGRTPARGYEIETWIEGEVTSGSYRLVELDPTLCVGNDCDFDGNEWRCSDRLELGIEVGLRTLDGAIEMHASGTALSARRGFAYGDSPDGTVFASLSDATGSLDLLPDPKLAILSADVVTYLRFEPDQTEGVLRPGITLTGGSTYYTHIIDGYWPDLR